MIRTTLTASTRTGKIGKASGLQTVATLAMGKCSKEEKKEKSRINRRISWRSRHWSSGVVDSSERGLESSETVETQSFMSRTISGALHLIGRTSSPRLQTLPTTLLCSPHMHLQTLPHLQKTPVLQYFAAKPKSISDRTRA